MAAQEFKIERGELLRIDAAPGDKLQVRLGDVWVTRTEIRRTTCCGPESR